MSKHTVFHILLIVQLVVFLFVLLRPFSLTPQGHVYTIIDKNFFYPNIILQGKEGAWRMIDTHTTLFSPRIFAYTFFIVLGKIAAIFDIHQVWMYLWARVIFGILVFYTTLWFILRILPKQYHILCLLFVLGIESGPLLSAWPEIKTLFEARMMIIRRFALPHHLAAQASGMLFIGLLMLSVQKATAKRLFGMAITGLISALSMPAYVFTFMLTAFPSWAVWSFLTRRVRQFLFPIIVASIVILAPNILFSFEFQKGPPWTNSAPNEKTWFTTEYIRMEYISTLLLYVPFLVLFLIILPLLWKKAEYQTKTAIIVFLSWIIGPFVWVAAAKTSWFPMPNHRLTDSYGFLPAGILAGIAVQCILSRFSNVRLRIIAGAILLSVAFVPSVYLSVHYLKQIFKAQETADYHIYPSKELWEGIEFLRTVPKMAGVMVREPFGEVLPAFANIRVYIGGIHNFPDWLSWQWIAGRFFSGTMTDEEVKTVLSTADISYVFYGPDEKAINTTGTLYPKYLTPVFSNSAVTVYAVQK
jgi:hypothetical protein